MEVWVCAKLSRGAGVKYEPWHYRFIGIEEAREWYESGLTLTEYFMGKEQYYAVVRLYNNFKVYRIEDDGTKRWISTPELFKELGYGWEDVVDVSKGELDIYLEREPIQ